jgi:gamma-glutamyltranspeptidase/glutathione hydrolase
MDYRARAQDYRLCGFPPPSSGAIAVGQILGILNHQRRQPAAAGRPAHGADWLHLYTEAARLAFADRALYVADPTSCSPRRQLDEPAGPGLPGQPRPAHRRAEHEGGPARQARRRASLAPMPDQPEYGTSHISIVDATAMPGHDHHHRRRLRRAQMVKGFC